MRILHTSDWHLGKTLEGKDRRAEQIKVLDEICQIAEAEDIDLVLIAGDIYQTVNPPAWAENLFYETLHRLNNYGKRGVAVIAGNHDQPERIRAANPLADKQGIYLIGLPHDQIETSIYQREGQVTTLNAGLGWLELAIPKANQSAVISMLPYPSESRLKTVLSDVADMKEIRNQYSKYIYQWFNNQRDHFRKDSINLAMSHLFVQGGEISESETEIQLGGAYTVSLQDIPDFFQYVALGHLHKPQSMKSATVRYSGSPLAYSFSEARYKKSVSIVEVHPNQPATLREIPLTSGKSLIQKKIKNGLPELEQWLNDEGSLQAWLDIELHVENNLSPEEIYRIRKLHDGIVNIRLIKPEQEIDLETISIEHRRPDELFTSFYQYKAGTAPKTEVVDLFNELFHLTEDEEESS